MVVYALTGSMAYVREMSIVPTLRSLALFWGFTVIIKIKNGQKGRQMGRHCESAQSRTVEA